MAIYELNGCAPRIGNDVWIAPSAEVIGDVTVADEASIWFGAVIRADNTTISIGRRSNIQEGVLLHSDPGVPLTIGSGVTVGHHAILHGCTIGNNVLIGMGATVLNKAVIADNCLIGARALVTEGKTFPPGSLIVGSPAKVVRRLETQEIEAFRAGSDYCAGKARQFHAELREITG